ncbi:RNA polymerase sigma factor [Pseudoruegeria sp. HB172150]|uniref:RNA polymerase sigma factor n=1 Tax=Pseudoruegeria sp. HB172150 TaxID=2721164 RepID=UPI0015525695|nr:RNA polymerase sigma factor [Pseudoruegeria sp. HB172150]
MDAHAQLLTQVAHGDKQALAALYRALEKPVYRFIHSRLNDPFESSDVLHDVFMEVWRSASRFEGRSKVQTWIFGIAYRKVIDLHRKRVQQDVTDDIPEQEDDSPDAATCLAAGQEAEHVRHCLGTLKDDHRSAISLAFYEDMTYAEIAEVQGVPEGTIKTRVFHAKKLLLRCLSGRIDRRVPA